MSDLAFWAGYGGTTEWDDLLTNMTGVKACVNSDFGKYDGYLTLESKTPYAAQPFDNLTGWTETNAQGGDCTIDPAGVVKIKTTTTNGSQALVSKDGFGNPSGDTTFSLDMAIKFTTLATKTQVSAGHYTRSCQVVYNDGTNQFYCTFCTDAGKLLLHWYTGTGYTNNFYDTGLTKDELIHNVIIRNNNGTSADFLLDGVKLTTFARRVAATAQKGYVDIVCYQDRAAVALEVSFDYANVISDYTNYLTDDVVKKSNILNAGAGKRYSKLVIDKDTANSTALPIKVRCASTSAGISSASWETVTSNVDFNVKGQYMEIDATFSDAGSGEYTPILKFIKGYVEDAPEPEGGDKAGLGMMGFF